MTMRSNRAAPMTPAPNVAAPNVAALAAEAVSVRFGDRAVLVDVDVAVRAGEWLALVGRNGCGKTTLLRVLAGLHRPDTGVVRVGAEELGALSRRDVARRIAVLPQALSALGGLTVRQLVAQGRFAVRGPLGMLGGGQDAVVDDAMAATGVGRWADAAVDRLSGGERQRVRLALALAQDAPVLLLDEPTTYLDVRHQLEMLDLVRRLQAERGLTVVTVLHDLAHAARADRVVALRDGRVHVDGAAVEVITEDLLAEVFAVRGRIHRMPGSTNLACTFTSPL